MEKKIVVGVIGLGVGLIHSKVINNYKNVELRTICDFNQKKLIEAKKIFKNCKYTINADDIFKDPKINLVVIASYDNFHFRHIKKSIINKKNFFVEKPFCQKENELKQLLTLLKKNRKIRFSSNLILRNSPHFIKIKKLINKIKLGEIYYLEAEYNYGRKYKLTKGWRGSIPFYSINLGGGIHLLDIILNLIKSKIISITSLGNKIATAKSNFKFNDCVTTLIKFKNGMHAKLLSNFSTVERHNHYFKIFGTKMNIKYNKDITKIYENNNKFKVYKKKYDNKDKSLVLKSFLKSIINDKYKSLISEKEIIDLMKVSLTIEKSLNSKKWLEVKY